MHATISTIRGTLDLLGRGEVHVLAVYVTFLKDKEEDFHRCFGHTLLGMFP